MAEARQCAGCRECCIQIEVKTLNKPGGVFCSHLDAKGCSIYEARPDACKDFSCAWLLGQMPKSYKPEKTGMVVWAGYTQLGLTVFGSYRKRPHIGTMKWLLGESYKFPVIVSNMGKNQVLYVQGVRCEKQG